MMKNLNNNLIDNLTQNLVDEAMEAATHFHPVYAATHCGSRAGDTATNPTWLTVTFPRLRFADENGIYNQIKHMLTEHDEIGQAYFESRDINHLAEEIADLMQSCATGLYILQRTHNIDINQVVALVTKKNRERGYECQ